MLILICILFIVVYTPKPKQVLTILVLVTSLQTQAQTQAQIQFNTSQIVNTNKSTSLVLDIPQSIKVIIKESNGTRIQLVKTVKLTTGKQVYHALQKSDRYNTLVSYSVDVGQMTLKHDTPKTVLLDSKRNLIEEHIIYTIYVPSNIHIKQI